LYGGGRMMEAGRELDKLIAEKILGWSAEKVGEIYEDWYSPSKNIGDAWQVINKLKEKGFYTDIEMESDFSYVVCVKDGYCDETISISVVSDAKTAPHAICLAALKAIEQS
jgi:uncharacterized protein YerC